MPDTALKRQPNDLGVAFVNPQSPDDERVPTAEEYTLAQHVLAVNAAQRPSEWMVSPTITIDSNRLLTVQGTFKSRLYSDPINLSIGAVIPALLSRDETVNRYDRLSLVLFGAVAGQEHDSAIGEISFDYYDEQNALTAVTKENARRFRAYYALVLSQSELTPALFRASLQDELVPEGGQARLTGTKSITFANKTTSGFNLGPLRVFASDPLLKTDVPYPMVDGLLEIIEICHIRRVQNYTEEGYTWGRNGEEPLTAEYSILNRAIAKEPDREVRLRSRLNSILQGVGIQKKAILNLTSGMVSGNAGRAGRAASSPNGSFAVANGQRISFLNAKVVQNECCKVSEAGNDGSGNALLTFELDTNVPSGTKFSAIAGQHRIFDSTGLEQTAFGTFLNLGQSGSLIWRASQGSTIKPGQVAYFCPMIEFPAGSGFDIPFSTVDEVWRSGTPLDAQNIRIGYKNDLTGYEQPVGGDYIVVLSPERAGLLYILKKVSITTTSTGTAFVGAQSKGCFAWIEGVSTRIDAPVKTGLAPNSTYNALVYHAPTAQETWQLQFTYPEYKGLGSRFDTTFLDDAVIVSNPISILTTQCGGSSVFQSDAAIRYKPIGMHLPSADSAVLSYELDAPIRFVNESNPGSLTTREQALLPCGYAMPKPGMVLKFEARDGIGTGRNIQGALQTREGALLGFRTIALDKRLPYLAMIAFLIRKGDQEKLVIATKVTTGGESVSIDALADTAFDVFEV